MPPPFGVDLVVGLFDLICQDRGSFPGCVEGEGFVCVYGADEEVVE